MWPDAEAGEGNRFRGQCGRPQKVVAEALATFYGTSRCQAVGRRYGIVARPDDSGKSDLSASPTFACMPRCFSLLSVQRPLTAFLDAVTHPLMCDAAHNTRHFLELLEERDCDSLRFAAMSFDLRVSLALRDAAQLFTGRQSPTTGNSGSFL